MREIIESQEAPAAIGPYSQAVRSGGQIWLSGQIGLDPENGALVSGGIEAETRQAMANLQAVLTAGGSGLERLLRTTVYLADMADFEAFNRTYAEFFSGEPPARACVAVAGLPRGARVEIEAVALV
jgi:2-iminobutanoate/2-iminopropanoate deaminase